MAIIGIVAEYNPFHTGHEYHIARSRELLGADSTVICVMSGDFVQRGEAALYSKFARAEAACRCGADLVIELPLPWALSSAEGFARGALGLLGALGATHISFGSECGDVSRLEKIAECLIDPMTNAEISRELYENANSSYASARQSVLERRLGDEAKLIEQPNNILAVEYIKAIYELRLDITPVTVQRVGSGHDSSGGTEGEPKSASELRRMILGGERVDNYIPKNALDVYLREESLGRQAMSRQSHETAILSRLRMFGDNYYNSLPDSGGGLGSRLCRAAHEEATLDGVLAAVKTKRYALSRIRRMCLCAALGIKNGAASELPPYARVLAANTRGCEYLRVLNNAPPLPIITKPAAARQMSAERVQLFELGAAANELYVLAYRAEQERRGGQDWRSSPKIVQND